LDVRSREARQFTNSTKSEFSPRWSPDGKMLAFISDREERPQIFLMKVNGGEATQLTEGKNGIRSFEWSPDGKQISFIATDPKSEAEEKKEKEKDDARVVDKDDKQARLWVIDIESRKVRQLSAAAWEIAEAHWLPQGDRLIVSATDHPGSSRLL
jgi:Tol biopolymer transport system component